MTTKTKTTTKTATMDTWEFSKALQRANILKHTTTSLPTLAYALIEFANNKAIITTTDMERAIRIIVKSSNSDTFSTLLPRTTTIKFLHGADGDISISQGSSETKLILSRKDIGDLNITTLKVADFPLVPQIPDNLEWHTLDGKWFCSMVKIIAIACAEEQSRPVLTGIACNDGAIAAADGFRLHVLKDSRLAFGLGGKQAIIPTETIQVLGKLFGKEETLEVGFELGMTQRVHFRSGDVTLTSQLIQGHYPNYQQLIPNKFDCKVSFSTPLMSQRLNMIDDKINPSGIVRFSIETTKKQEQVCSIVSLIEDEDSYHFSCPVKYGGDVAKIAFNLRYMLDAIKPFSLCNMEITSPFSSGKFTGDIEGLIIVVMPMFVQW